MGKIFIEQSESVFKGDFFELNNSTRHLFALKIPMEFISDGMFVYNPTSDDDPIAKFIDNYKDEIKFKFSPLGPEYTETMHIYGVLLRDMCDFVCQFIDNSSDDPSGYSRAGRLYTLIFTDNYWPKRKIEFELKK